MTRTVVTQRGPWPRSSEPLLRRSRQASGWWRAARPDGRRNPCKRRCFARNARAADFAAAGGETIAEGVLKGDMHDPPPAPAFQPPPIACLTLAQRRMEGSPVASSLCRPR